MAVVPAPLHVPVLPPYLGSCQALALIGTSPASSFVITSHRRQKQQQHPSTSDLTSPHLTTHQCLRLHSRATCAARPSLFCLLFAPASPGTASSASSTPRPPPAASSIRPLLPPAVPCTSAASSTGRAPPDQPIMFKGSRKHRPPIQVRVLLLHS